MRRWRILLISIATLALMTGNASAVVVSGSSLPSTPWEDFAYGNVGLRGSGSGVYLGNGWVLTAKHVGAGDITFGDTTYHYDGENALAVKNPTGYSGLVSTYTDLTLFHLTEEPDLPEIQIAETAPPKGAQLYYVGYGRQRAATMTYWNVNSSYVWTESTASTYYWGYKTLSSREFSWGYNFLVSDGSGPGLSNNIINVNGIDIVTLMTVFDSKESDSQAVDGDSGGATFYQNSDGTWILAGIISSVKTLKNAPTKAIVDATTHSVDLAFYRDEILNVIASTASPPIPGDANGDGVVDGSDVTILAGNWQITTNQGPSAGDFNNDGIVDGSDITILAGNWQYGVIGTQADLSTSMTVAFEGSGVATIPEPSSLALLIGIVLMLGLAARKTIFSCLTP